MATYKSSGVDIDAGEELVRRIKAPVRSTFSKNVLNDIGLFGGFYKASFKGYRQPVLVSSVDGVGTKLKVAVAMNRHETIGQDLVNHSVNDILVCGAKPLFFLDYFAAGKLNPDVAERVILGFVKACRENGCALVGGETAEMPGVYAPEEYDIAGTVVGVVDQKKILDGRKVRKGDVVIGLASTGLHTNGYSLARRVLFGSYQVTQYIDELGTTVGEALMAVHRSYFKVVYPIISRYPIHALSHITGGGIEGNTRRVLPNGRSLRVDWSAWERPPLFSLIQKTGGVPEEDMRRTFNLGIGMAVIVPPAHADRVLKSLRNEHPVVIGDIR